MLSSNVILHVGLVFLFSGKNKEQNDCFIQIFIKNKRIFVISGAI